MKDGYDYERKKSLEEQIRILGRRETWYGEAAGEEELRKNLARIHEKYGTLTAFFEDVLKTSVRT